MPEEELSHLIIARTFPWKLTRTMSHCLGDKMSGYDKTFLLYNMTGSLTQFWYGKFQLKVKNKNEIGLPWFLWWKDIKGLCKVLLFSKCTNLEPKPKSGSFYKWRRKCSFSSLYRNFKTNLAKEHSTIKLPYETRGNWFY